MGTTDGPDSSQGALFSRDLAPGPRSPWVLRAVVVGAVALGCLGVWLWVLNAEGGAIRAMAPAQREALFKEAWKDQRMRCPRTAEQADTAEQCRQRAEFLMLFPQCDETCRSELAPLLQAPVK